MTKSFFFFGTIPRGGVEERSQERSLFQQLELRVATRLKPGLILNRY